MLDFMVVAAPRSRTTWMANWLTTDTTLCIHDPLEKYALKDLNHIPANGKVLGASCTALALFPEWLNKHQARKVILHRPIADINKSLEAMGAPAIDPVWAKWLDNISGWHVDIDYIDYDPEGLYTYLTNKKFDYYRYANLKAMLVEPDTSKIVHDPSRVRALVEAMKNEQLELGV